VIASRFATPTRNSDVVASSPAALGAFDTIVHSFFAVGSRPATPFAPFADLEVYVPVLRGIRHRIARMRRSETNLVSDQVRPISRTPSSTAAPCFVNSVKFVSDQVNLPRSFRWPAPSEVCPSSFVEKRYFWTSPSPEHTPLQDPNWLLVPDARCVASPSGWSCLVVLAALAAIFSALTPNPPPERLTLAAPALRPAAQCWLETCSSNRSRIFAVVRALATRRRQPADRPEALARQPPRLAPPCPLRAPASRKPVDEEAARRFFYRGRFHPFASPTTMTWPTGCFTAITRPSCAGSRRARGQIHARRRSEAPQRPRHCRARSSARPGRGDRNRRACRGRPSSSPTTSAPR